MFDARYFAYATISVLLVMSPGAAMAIVMEAAVEDGRAAALATVLGINVANSTLALASALGMSVVFHQWPWSLQVVKVGGAAYLTYLGLRALWFAVSGRRKPGTTGATTPVHPGPNGASRAAWLGRGAATNFLNPSVVLFYMTLLPQFIGRQDPFFARFLVLAVTHVSMSLVWLTTWALALGAMARAFTRPTVRRVLEGITGTVLIGLGARLLVQ